MTVVCWDGKTLAADKRAVNCGFIFRVTKIRKINGNLVASSGDFSPIMAMFDWYERGADIEKLPECQKHEDRYALLLVITPKKKIYRYEQDCLPYEIEEKKIAIGSGRDYAIGAMHMGADAKTAVKVASVYCNSCGNGVDTLSFDK